MEGSQHKTEKFLRDNILLILLLLFALAIRIYLFTKTYNQALWWDEADYLNVAKHFAFGIEDISAPWRARGFSLFYSLFYFMKLPEIVIKFIPIIVSMLGVYLTYYIGKEFYNKYVGLIAGLIMAVFYEGLFWSMRFEMGLHAIVIWCISAFLFWKGYCRKGKIWQVALAFGLASYGIFAYESIGFIFAFFGIYLLLTEQFSFLKNKRFWIGVIVALLVAAPFLYYNYSSFGHPYPRFQRFASADFTPSEGAALDYQRSFVQMLPDLFSYFTAMPNYLTIFFLIALLIGLLPYIETLLGIDLLMKRREHNKDIFILLWALTLLVSFSFVVALTGFENELRLIFPAFPAMFIIIGRGFMKIYEFIKKHNKLLAVSCVLILLGAGSYLQLISAYNLTEFKKEAYKMEPVAGEWLKENTNKDDYIAVCNQDVPFYFYTERKLLKFGHNSTLADELILLYKPKYVVLNAYQYDCAFDFVQVSNSTLVGANIFFQDEEHTQPMIIIFQPVYGQI
ncbi:glycosyltransferase family 39 protein [archaeon]|nr:glycosyltransferase family 39 protein [archaeon]